MFFELSSEHECLKNVTDLVIVSLQVEKRCCAYYDQCYKLHKVVLVSSSRDKFPRLVTRKGDTCNNAVQLAMKQCSQQVERKCCTLDQALISVSTGHLQPCQFCEVGERVVVFKVEAISLHVSEI